MASASESASGGRLQSRLPVHLRRRQHDEFHAQAGLPLACLVLIPAGVYRLWKGGPLERLILVGLVTSPLAVVLTGTLDLNRYRGLFVLPFGALVASRLLRDDHRPPPRVGDRRRPSGRQHAAPVLGFYRNYMTDYRARSAPGSAATSRRDPRRAGPPGRNRSVFVSGRIPYADVLALLFAGEGPAGGGDRRRR